MLGVVLLVAACGSLEDKEQFHFSRAMEHVEAGDDGRALAEFRNVLRLNPLHADAHYQVGLLHERAERWNQAIAAFREAAQQRPGFVGPNVRLGTLMLMANEVDAAERAAGAILEAHPGQPDALAIEAAVMLRRGDLEGAEATAQAVLDEQPHHGAALSVLIGVLQARGQTNQAIARLDAALDDLSGDVGLRMLKLALLEQIGDRAGMGRVLDALVALEPERAMHRVALAGLVRQTDVAAAAAVLREGIAAGADEAVLGREMVRLAYELEGPDAAEAELHDLIAHAVEPLPFRFMLAELRSQQGDAVQAEQVLRTILAGEDVDAGREAQAAIARLRLVQGDLAGAKAEAEALIAADRDHPNGNLVRGVIHLLEDETDEALRSARTARRRHPDWTAPLPLLAEAHLRRGEGDLAIAVLREIVVRDPADLAATEILATLLTQRGDLTAALDLWDRLVRMEHDPARALVARAEIRISQQQWDAAAMDVEQLLATPGAEVPAAALAGALDFGRGAYEASRAWFGRALDEQPEAGPLVVAVVRAYVAEDNVEGAMAFLQHRIDGAPDDALALKLKGELAAGLGDMTAAVVAFERAIAARPDWEVPYLRLAVLERDLRRDPQAAVAVFERGLAALPGQPLLARERARSLVGASRYAAAIAAYGDLAARFPNDDVLVNNYAALVAAHAHDDPRVLEEAFDLAQRFRTSTNGHALDTLGWLYYRRGEYLMAVSLIERAMALLGSTPELHYHLGMALKGAGQTERARLELEQALAAGTIFWGVDEARAALRTLAIDGDDAAGAAPGQRPE